MLAEIKKVKIDELKKRLIEKETAIRTVQEEKDKLLRLYSDLETASLTLKKYNAIKKAINRKGYEKLKEEESNIKSKLQERGFNSKNYNSQEWDNPAISAFNREVVRLTSEKENIESEITRMEHFNSLNDFNMNFNQACAFLKENGLPILLSEEDKNIRLNNVNYNSLSDFVLVHKTSYLPSNNTVLATKGAGVKNETEVVLDVPRNIEYFKGRNTLHFSVNSEVSELPGGNNWNASVYAILIPFEDMPLDQLRSAMAVDTFFEGDISLPNSAMILCPEEQVKEAASANPNLTVVGYTGTNVMGYAEAMISMMGKKVEKADMWGWVDKEKNGKYNEIVQGLGFSTTPHLATPERAEEIEQENLNKFIELIKIIQNNNLINTPDDISAIYEKIKDDILYLPTNKIREISERLKEIGITLPDDIIEHIEYICNDLSNFRDKFYMDSFLQTHPDILRNINYKYIMSDYSFLYGYAPNAVAISALNQILKNNVKEENEEEIGMKKAS